MNELGQELRSEFDAIVNEAKSDGTTEEFNSVKEKHRELEVRVEACFEELADVGLKAEENSNKLAEVVISRDLLPVISTGFLLIVFQGFTRCFSGGILVIQKRFALVL